LAYFGGAISETREPANIADMCFKAEVVNPVTVLAPQLAGTLL
jgi:hypothetical protein